MGTEDALPKLGKYELLAELATGGMATVFVARDLGVPGAERLVVIKRVHRHLLHQPQFREMFQDEARVVAQIRHPNVVRLMDVIGDSNELLLVLEYVESVPLSSFLHHVQKAGERLAPPIVSRLVSDMLLGLHAAHEAKDVRGNNLHIVHRDVSPQNVLVSTDGIGHLIDFGIAKAAARVAETTGGVIKGKLAYMSPEQAKGVEVDRRSDVFSAGVVLYEALTGKRAFRQDDSNGSSVLLQILLDTVEPPSKVAPGVPEAVDIVIEQVLSRVRDERFATAEAFHDALVGAVPPASPREVATVVDRFCGAVIARRREEILGLLQGLAPHEARATEPTPFVPTLHSHDEEVAHPSNTKVAAVIEESERRGGRRSLRYALAALACIGIAALVWARVPMMRVQAGLSGQSSHASAPPTTSPAAISAAPASAPSEASGHPQANAPEPPKVTPPATPAAVETTFPNPRTATTPRPRRKPPASAASPGADAANEAAVVSPGRTDLHPENPY
jgi:eukaryotic-like serine/threonine-protein kinase